MNPAVANPGAVHAPLTDEALRRRSQQAAVRARRALKQQQALVLDVVEATQHQQLDEQPLMPRWLTLLLASIVLALLYLAWHTPGG